MSDSYQTQIDDLKRRLDKLMSNEATTAICAKASYTARGSAVGSTTLYAVPANRGGLYRINWFAIITRAATTSSTLGALALAWTDPDTNAASTATAGGFLGDGTTGTTNTTNLLDAKIYGTAIIDAKASNNITYTFGYASGGATSMQYSLYVEVEYLA